MIPVKQPDETIEHYVQELNDATLLMVEAAAPSANTRWYTIIFNALGTFLRIFIGKGFIRNGIDGFVTARLASIFSLVKYIKRWEFQMCRKNGRNIRPPTSKEDIHRIRNKYSS
jgi:hypothetical protein